MPEISGGGGLSPHSWRCFPPSLLCLLSAHFYSVLSKSIRTLGAIADPLNPESEQSTNSNASRHQRVGKREQRRKNVWSARTFLGVGGWGGMTLIKITATTSPSLQELTAAYVVSFSAPFMLQQPCEVDQAEHDSSEHCD